MKLKIMTYDDDDEGLLSLTAGTKYTFVIFT